MSVTAEMAFITDRKAVPALPQCAICGRAPAAVVPLESPKQLAEVSSCQRHLASRRRGWRQPGQRRRSHLAGAVTELSSERAAETRGIREAQILGDRRDRLFGRGIA